MMKIRCMIEFSQLRVGLPQAFVFSSGFCNVKYSRWHLTPEVSWATQWTYKLGYKQGDL